MLASLSIGGLALGLAAQDTVANLFGAVAVFVDKPFRVGDRIKLDDRWRRRVDWAAQHPGPQPGWLSRHGAEQDDGQCHDHKRDPASAHQDRNEHRDYLRYFGGKGAARPGYPQRHLRPASHDPRRGRRVQQVRRLGLEHQRRALVEINLRLQSLRKGNAGTEPPGQTPVRRRRHRVRLPHPNALRQAGRRWHRRSR